jgi:hypothetical protein
LNLYSILHQLESGFRVVLLLTGFRMVLLKPCANGKLKTKGKTIANLHIMVDCS